MIVAFLLGSVVLQAQRTCGADAYQDSLMQDEGYRLKFKKLKEEVKQRRLARTGTGCSNPYTVPVAVHFGGGVTAANMQCLIDASLAQIAVLNEDFAALNADINDYVAISNACPADYPMAALHSGACIEFCLARFDHPVSSGISDGDFAITVGQHQYPSAGADWAGYMNIFVEDLGASILGRAPILGAADPDGNGIQINTIAFGGPGVVCASGVGINTNPDYNLGRTGTHEAGHYFGLEHVFLGCGNADGIDDTPDQDQANIFCPNFNFLTCASTANNSCGEPDFYFNFMDYVDDFCMVMFTTDQAAVMSAAGNHNLWNQTVCRPICEVYDAPLLSDDLVQNTCPFSIINLGDFHTGQVPLNAELIWSESSALPASTADHINPVVISSGTYYARYYNAIEGCYGPASEIKVELVSCCEPAPDLYVSEDIAFSGNLAFGGNIIIEAGATLKFDGAWAQFYAGKSITVESGGKLVLSHSTLASCAPPTTWGGIVVLDGGELEALESYIYSGSNGVDAKAGSTVDINTLNIEGPKSYTGTGLFLDGAVNAPQLRRLKITGYRHGIRAQGGGLLYHLDEGEMDNILFGLLASDASIVMRDYVISGPAFGLLLSNSPGSVIENNQIGYALTGIQANFSPFTRIAGNTIGWPGQSGSRGISMYLSGGSRIEDNPHILAANRGISLWSSPSAIIDNYLEVLGNNNQSGGGIELIEGAGYQVKGNYLTVKQSSFGVEANNCTGTEIKNNDISLFSTISARTAAIRSMGSSAEEIEYNIINGVANTTGMIAQNTTGNIFGCNKVAGTAEGLGIYYNAELHDIRGNTFDAAIDLAIRSAIGEQHHRGNVFIGGKARANELSAQEILDSRFFVNPGIAGHLPSDPVPGNGEWFRTEDDLNYYTCSGVLGPNWKPFGGDEQELCAYYDGLKALLQSEPERAFVKLYHLLRYAAAEPGFSLPGCITADSVLQGLCGLNELAAAGEVLAGAGIADEASAAALLALQEQYKEQPGSEGRDSLSAQMGSELAALRPGLQAGIALTAGKLDALGQGLELLGCGASPIAGKWAAVYRLYIKYLLDGALSEADQTALLAHSMDCSDVYGDAVHLARAMAATFDEAYFDLYDDCLGGGPELRGTGGTLPASGIRLYPNPSQGVVNVRLPMGYDGQLVVYGPDGRALLQRRIVDGNLQTLHLGGQSGLYLARFLSDSGQSSTHKLIVMD